MKKGECGECGKPIGAESRGYCSAECVDVVHKREREQTNKAYPFEVVDGDGTHLDCFATEEEADEYVSALHRSRIVNHK